MEPEEDIIAEICGACAKTNCTNCCSKLRRELDKKKGGGGAEMTAIDALGTVTPARRGRMSAWEKKLRDEAYSARGEDTPEKIEWFKKGIARRRRDLFSMDFAMQAYE